MLLKATDSAPSDQESDDRPLMGERSSARTESDGSPNSKSKPASVSIIIPAYNASGTLPACLASVAAAEHEGPVEIIVVDDASTDDTASIAESLGCLVVRRTSNGGPARSRNAGAKAASGDVLLFIDADTEMRPDTIRQAIQALDREGVSAVTGMYEAEPVNDGFFPRYYAYLKYHAFTAGEVDRTSVFGAQCGAISKLMFDKVGGYRALDWGTDVENEEFGLRVNRQGPIALSRDFRVSHNFPVFRKLLYVFTNRVYWWILFRHYSKSDETVLMTRGFGYATAAPTAALLCALATVVLPTGFGRSGMALSAIAFFLLFVWGYAGFWRMCYRRRGVVFAGAAGVASALFSVAITVSAFFGYASVVWHAITRQELPFERAALGKT